MTIIGLPKNMIYLENVFEMLHQIVDNEISIKEYRDLFTLALDTGYQKIKERSLEYNFFQSVDYPIFVYEALGKNPEDAIPLAAACTLLHMSADMLDDVSDNDLPRAYMDTNLNHVLMVANEFLSFIAQKTISLLIVKGIADPLQGLEINNVFSNGMHAMSEGQYLNMTYTLANTTIDDLISQVLIKKTGGQHEIFSRSGAILAGASLEKSNQVATFGRKMGVAGQVINDLQDIWQKAVSPDLLNMRATSVILHTYQNTDHKQLFCELMESLKENYDLNVINEIKKIMLDAGTVQFTCELIKRNTDDAFVELEKSVGSNVYIFEPVYHFFSQYFYSIPLIGKKQETYYLN